MLLLQRYTADGDVDVDDAVWKIWIGIFYQLDKEPSSNSRPYVNTGIIDVYKDQAIVM